MKLFEGMSDVEIMDYFINQPIDKIMKETGYNFEKNEHLREEVANQIQSGIKNKQRRVYEVVKPLKGYFSKYKNKAVGHRFSAEILFKREYNINQLLKEGKIVEIPKIFPFEIEIVSQNQHSVWTKCKECLHFGINMPLNKKCANCGCEETITYYDADSVQRFINSLTERLAKNYTT